MGAIKNQNQPLNKITNTEHNPTLGSKDVSLISDLDDLTSILSQPNFELKVSCGLLPGFSFVEKFGESTDIDTGDTPVDIWQIQKLYVYDAYGTAPITHISSDNAADNQLTRVQGLDIQGNEIIQEATLDGINYVALTTPLWRVYRASNRDSTDYVGEIRVTVGESRTDDNTRLNMILNNGVANNQSLMALYTIPNGKVALFYRGELGMARTANNGSIEGAIYARFFGGVFRIQKDIDIAIQGNGNYEDKKPFPLPIPALTDLKISVIDVSNNNSSAFGAMTILLVNESFFSNAFLQAIEQPGY